MQFSARIESYDRPNFYQDMAILQDCRAVPLLRKRYLELRGHSERGYYEEILDVGNCLYHIPCDEAVRTARELEATEKDARLRDRLRRIVSR